MTRKAYIKTYGCQMNVYDSQRMADALAPMGYTLSSMPGEADLVILNTCHIREKAAEKVYSEIGKLRRLKSSRAREGRDLIVAVSGCVAQAEGEEILRRAPAVDLVIGPQVYHRLPELLTRFMRTGQPIIATDFPSEDKFDHLAAPSRDATRARGVAAFLTIQEGCDKFCTFCVVPYTRGAEASRPVAKVVSEARSLAEAGVRELTLLGQNVNAYRGEGLDGEYWPLARLLDALAGIDGIERLRFTTSHPRDMSADLIRAFGENGKLMPYLHLPVQSGSDRILKAMNRGHHGDDYLRLIAQIRASRPDIAISGDFIVGFPGETEKDFADTLALVREVEYASAFSFKYSPRPGTPAAAMALQVEDETKTARLADLQDLLRRQQRAFNHACVGRRMAILIEKPGRHPGQLIGRSPYLQSVHLEGGGEAIGDTVTVTIDDVGANSLSAHTVGRRDSALVQPP
jgi:tRNA-2-methylthio-N6-dimethylallyladenosine synthase